MEAPRMQNKHLLVVIIVAAAINAWNLQSKHKNRETASYDGDERPVTETDIWVARGFVLLLVAMYLYSLFLGS
jgi:uncharacterized membrane protein YidH (DUF202 family)